MSVKDYITEINITEGIDLIKVFSKFEKKLKKCFKLYSEKSGYEDYKMNDMDVLILYSIWKHIKEIGHELKITDLLIIMYSYYKIEEFYFEIDTFNFNNDIYNTILSSNVIKIINYFIYID